MNTPNPLVPQGSSLEQKRSARSRVKIAVFFVLTIHVVGLIALLVQGCRPKQEETGQTLPPPELPPIEPIAIPPADTNQVLLPPVQELPPGSIPGESAYPTAPGMETVPPVQPVTPAPGTTQDYVIKRGDTFYSIGKQFGVTMQAIKNANPNVEPTRLQVGQKIVIPPPASTTAEAATAVPSASGEILYTVVSGDTLSKIATQHGTTWQAIQQLNNLPTTNIKVGQKLRIPASQAPTAGTPGGGM
jgi:LysM repeat protein